MLAVVYLVLQACVYLLLAFFKQEWCISVLAFFAIKMPLLWGSPNDYIWAAAEGGAKRIA